MVFKGKKSASETKAQPTGVGARVNPIKMQTVRRGLIHFPPRIFGSKQK